MREKDDMKRQLLLCVALVWAQIALAGHGIEHACQEPDEACVEWLVLPGFATVPAARLRLLSATPEPEARKGAVPLAPILARARTSHFPQPRPAAAPKLILPLFAPTLPGA